MSRPLRIEYEGAWYHVMSRGAGRRRVFRSDDQRRYFLSLLADTSERFNAQWHAYCLMGNHYHLLICTPDGNLQRIMRHVNGLYTQYYNRTQKRDGALFRGRYKAILVDAQVYWAQLSRYIHRNPIEASLVDRLDRYPWSSYPAYIGVATPPDWLHYRYILESVARRHAKARYRVYVEAGTDDDIAAYYAADRQSTILGGDVFRNSVVPRRKPSIDVPEIKAIRSRPSIEQIVAAVAQHFAVETESIWEIKRGRRSTNSARAMAMFLCQQHGDMRLADIAVRFGLKHYASAGASIRQFRQRTHVDPALRELANTIILDLTP